MEIHDIVFLYFLGPPVIGGLRDLTGTYTSGMYFSCACFIPVSITAIWELIAVENVEHLEDSELMDHGKNIPGRGLDL